MKRHILKSWISCLCPSKPFLF